MDLDLKSLAAKLNPSCFDALDLAASACVSRSGYEVTVEDFLQPLCDGSDHDLPIIFQYYGLSMAEFRKCLHHEIEQFRSGNTDRPVLSARLVRLIRDAWLLASVDFGLTEIRSGIILLTLARSQKDLSLRAYGDLISRMPVGELYERLFDIVGKSSESARHVAANAGQDPNSALGKYATDFTAKAQAGEIDPVFCRDREIRQMVDILSRRRKNNPIIVGDAGVGKTAVIEGLALRVVDEDVPDVLRGVRILGLDLGLLQAGASVKGEFEKRLTQVLKEVHADPTIILFIDEAHTLIGSGGQQGTGDAANLLKPALARGEIRAMAATTWSEYKKYFEKDPALARRFQLVKLDEPSALESATIMRGLRSRYEQVHRVYIRDDAVVAAAELSARFIAGRQLPDKAIDVLDTACARVSIGLSAKPASLDDQEREIQALERKRDALRRDLAVQFKLDNPELAEMETEIQRLGAECEVLRDRWQRERAVVDRIVELRARLHELTDAPEEADTEGKTRSEALSEIQVDLEIARGELLAVTGDAPLVPYEVTPEVVGKVISDWTGVPLGKVVRDEAQTLLDFVARMRAWVLGQDSALTLIGDRIRASKAGLGNPNQPIAVFMLPGPSGVGKTETALAVADLLFGGRHSLISINMSEFQEKHTVSRLIGSPPGYVGYGEGGVLSEAVRQRPYSVVLLDEVEKGHPDVMNLFYQVFDKGELADGEGRLIDFKNTVLFLTSNLASDVLVTHCLQNESVDDESLRSAIRPVLADFFRPALLARMDIVPYRPLSQPVLSEIIERKLNGVAERLEESHDLGLDYSSELLAFIRERCTEFESGARNIETVINRYVLPPLSRHLLEGREEEAAQSRGVHLGIGDDNDVAVTRMAA